MAEGGPPLNSLLIPPRDDVTAGLDISASPPAYHDMDVLHYMKFDAQEWAGRVKKYKQEVVRNAERVRVLKEEVDGMRKQYDEDSELFEKITNQTEEAVAESEAMEASLKEEQAKKEEIMSDVKANYRQKQNLRKTKGALSNEIAQMRARTALLQGEVEVNRKKCEGASTEKGQLTLERDWFHRERVLLQYTTEHEMQNFARMKEEIDALRSSLQESWLDAKRIDVSGHIRATKTRPGEDEWFAARTRALVSSKGGH